LPVETIEFVIEALVEAVAVATRVDLVVNAGGGPPLAIAHVASGCPGVHAGADDAMSVSDPKLPVSTDVLMKRCPVVLTYVPAPAAVTLTLIEHVLLGTIVAFANESEVAPASGVGVKLPAPHPL
jgi:hypothetical protein